MNEPLFSPVKKGKLFVVSAPAGCGKTTLVKKVLKAYPDHFSQSISYTTRGKRDAEQEGKDYFFVSKKTFLEKKEKGDFIETNKIFDHEYGTDSDQIKNLTLKGKNVILVIDIGGARELKKRLSACCIFISPPSKEELRRRLVSRGSETDSSLETRLGRACEEMEQAVWFDYNLVNDDLERAYQILVSILVAENHRNNNT